MSDNNKISVSVTVNRQDIQASKEDVKALTGYFKELVTQITATTSALASLGKAAGVSATTNGQTGLPKAPTVSGIPTAGGGGGGGGGGKGDAFSGIAVSAKEAAQSVQLFSKSIQELPRVISILDDVTKKSQAAFKSVGGILDQYGRPSSGGLPGNSLPYTRAREAIGVDYSDVIAQSAYHHTAAAQERAAIDPHIRRAQQRAERDARIAAGQEQVRQVGIAQAAAESKEWAAGIEAARARESAKAAQNIGLPGAPVGFFPGLFSRDIGGIGSGVGAAAERLASRMGLPSGMASSFGNFMGGPGLALGVAAGALYTGYRAANWMSEGYSNAREIQLDQVMNERGRQYSRAAAMVSPYRNYALAAAHLDVSTMAATNAVTGDKNLMASLTNIEAFQEFAGRQVGRDAGLALGAQVSTWARDRQMEIGPAAYEAFLSSPGTGGEINPIRAQAKTVLADFMATRPQMLQQAIESAKMIQNPLWQEATASFAANLGNRARISRATGFAHGSELAIGFTKRLQAQPAGGTAEVYDVVNSDKWMNYAAKAWGDYGIDEGELAGAMSRVRGTGVGYQRHLGGVGLINMEAGGFQNVLPMLRGISSQTGSAAAGGAYLRGTLQRMSGAGGLDPVVSSELSMGLLQATNGGYLTGTSMINNLAMAAGGLVRGGGVDVGGQQMRQDMFIRGLQSSQKFGEKGSPLQRWLSYDTAMGSMGATIGAENLLAMNTAELIALARTDPSKLTYAQKTMGLTPEAARAQLSSSSRYSLTAINPEKLGTPEQRRLYELAIQSGGVAEAVIAQTSGLKGKAKSERILELAQTYGMMSGPSQGLTGAEASDAYMSLFAGYTELAPSLKTGKGAGAAKLDPATRAGLEAERRLKENQSQLVMAGDLMKQMFIQAPDSAIKAANEAKKQGEAMLDGKGGFFGMAIDSLNTFAGTVQAAERAVAKTFGVTSSRGVPKQGMINLPGGKG